MKRILVLGWLMVSQLFLAPGKSTAAEIDLQNIKISGYTQGRYQALEEDGKIDGGDIRRARLDLKGEISERFDYRSHIEFGGNKGPFLLDATIGYTVNSHLKITVGQFKIPFSQENLTSSPKLELINRSQVVEALVSRGKDVIGNQNGRDIGFQVGGSDPLFDYALGIFNGAGINVSDTNEEKDYIARIILHPVKNLDIGASYANGWGNWQKNKTLTNQNRDRVGGEVSYIYDALSLKGEYISGKDGDINKNGWYFQAGYFVIPKKFQGVIKYDTFDPDTKKTENAADVYTFGGNWYFNKGAFLQIDYELKKEEGTRINNNALIGQFTLQF